MQGVDWHCSTVEKFWAAPPLPPPPPPPVLVLAASGSPATVAGVTGASPNGGAGQPTPLSRGSSTPTVGGAPLHHVMSMGTMPYVELTMPCSMPDGCGFFAGVDVDGRRLGRKRLCAVVKAMPPTHTTTLSPATHTLHHPHSSPYLERRAQTVPKHEGLQDVRVVEQVG